MEHHLPPPVPYICDGEKNRATLVSDRGRCATGTSSNVGNPLHVFALRGVAAIRSTGAASTARAVIGTPAGPRSRATQGFHILIGAITRSTVLSGGDTVTFSNRPPRNPPPLLPP